MPLVESDDSELSVAPDEFELELLVYGRGRVLLDLQGGGYPDGTIVALLAIDDGARFNLWVSLPKMLSGQISLGLALISCAAERLRV